MGRTRIYKNNAEKQKAYRERQRQKFNTINGEQLTQNIVTKRNAQHKIIHDIRTYGSTSYQTLDAIHTLLTGKNFRGKKSTLLTTVIKLLSESD